MRLACRGRCVDLDWRAPIGCLFRARNGLRDVTTGEMPLILAAAPAAALGQCTWPTADAGVNLTMSRLSTTMAAR